MAKLFRVKTPHAVRHPDTGLHVVPNPRVPYSADDPLVKAYPWLFQSDAEVESGVERATRRPGERSAARKPRKAAAKKAAKKAEAPPAPDPAAEPKQTPAASDGE